MTLTAACACVCVCTVVLRAMGSQYTVYCMPRTVSQVISQRPLLLNINI